MYVGEAVGGGGDGGDGIFLRHLQVADVEEQIEIGVAEIGEPLESAGGGRQSLTGKVLDADANIALGREVGDLGQSLGKVGQQGQVVAGDDIGRVGAEVGGVI